MLIDRTLQAANDTHFSSESNVLFKKYDSNVVKDYQKLFHFELTSIIFGILRNSWTNIVKTVGLFADVILYICIPMLLRLSYIYVCCS